MQPIILWVYCCYLVMHVLLFCQLIVYGFAATFPPLELHKLKAILLMERVQMLDASPKKHWNMVARFVCLSSSEQNNHSIAIAAVSRRFAIRETSGFVCCCFDEVIVFFSYLSFLLFSLSLSLSLSLQPPKQYYFADRRVYPFWINETKPYVATAISCM